MKTIEVTVKFLDPRYQPTPEECMAFVNGDCAACGGKDTVALQTSDEFTDFYFCHECDLHIHRELLEMLTGAEVPSTADAVHRMMSELTK